jgi:tetratricopeptide (TPR) repeat protein/TolB-like protein
MMGMRASSGERFTSVNPSHRRSKGLRVGVLPFISGGAPEDSELASAAGRGLAAALRQLGLFEVVTPDLPTHRAVQERISGLDYLVEGALCAEGKRVQISVRLLDLHGYARTLWYDRSVLPVAKLPTWSGLAAAHLTAATDPVASFFEGRPRQRERDGAAGLLLSALTLMSTLERRKYEEAGKLIDRALEIEPDNAMASAWAAFWQVIYFGQGWTQNFLKAWAIAQTRVRSAIALSPDNPELLTICGHASSFLGRDYDAALDYFDRARRVNPELEALWCWSAATYSYIGEPGMALQRLKRFSDLSPTNPCYIWSQNIHSVAYAFAGEYEKAVASGRRVIKLNPSFVNGYKPLIAALGHLGRAEEAKPYVDKLLALEPNFTVERFAKVYPIKYESDREHYMKGLRLAGVPEQ